jgi:hypothetical protein
MKEDNEIPLYPSDLWLGVKLDYKWQANSHLALLFGGGGISPGSGYIGGDAAVIVGCAVEKPVLPHCALRLWASGPIGPSVSVPSFTLLGAGGLKANISDPLAVVFEGGAGGIFPVTWGSHGVAGYGLIGINLRL